MTTFEQSGDSKSKAQLAFAQKLAMEVRDMMSRAGLNLEYGAGSLAKYFDIDDLKTALVELKAGREVKFN